ncbi:MAG: hypothetical protein HDQ88_08700 [Clostridia bacterium]|nr:hypothetical protein [Clostridia bacterium]
MDDEIEVSVHKTYELAQKALVDDLMNEANIKQQNDIEHEIDASTLDEQDCARLFIHNESALLRYHYIWQIVRIPEPEN